LKVIFGWVIVNDFLVAGVRDQPEEGMLGYHLSFGTPSVFIDNARRRTQIEIVRQRRNRRI